ncbi:hypothetical protein EDEG_01127 [Edhazardia aedis USNM 41457]|uniref:Uncharacterized protein n=1 Tax=Edhazardia aedis (strain USNM 41457) TaxID=1003232 RepID=J9DB08_EDHAE|nr:hypothetical protein EDEG_01127 [Edhazardia aedis USNM 41457]|eukprot:EJW04679.1 hypothetical protein EDEG_01127 [Edhazardia aedis USNM 41457]
MSEFYDKIQVLINTSRIKNKTELNTYYTELVIETLQNTTKCTYRTFLLLNDLDKHLFNIPYDGDMEIDNIEDVRCDKMIGGARKIDFYSEEYLKNICGRGSVADGPGNSKETMYTEDSQYNFRYRKHENFDQMPSEDVSMVMHYENNPEEHKYVYRIEKRDKNTRKVTCSPSFANHKRTNFICNKEAQHLGKGKSFDNELEKLNISGNRVGDAKQELKGCNLNVTKYNFSNISSKKTEENRYSGETDESDLNKDSKVSTVEKKSKSFKGVFDEDSDLSDKKNSESELKDEKSDDIDKENINNDDEEDEDEDEEDEYDKDENDDEDYDENQSEKDVEEEEKTVDEEIEKKKLPKLLNKRPIFRKKKQNCMFKNESQAGLFDIPSKDTDTKEFHVEEHEEEDAMQFLLHKNKKKSVKQSLYGITNNHSAPYDIVLDLRKKEKKGKKKPKEY